VKAASLGRLGGWLAGVWAGLMAGVGVVAAPVLFTALPRAEAGRVAASLFSLEATIGLCIGAVLAMIGLQLGRFRSEQGTGSRFGSELVLALAALLSIVLGYYALQPMMASARASVPGTLSFGALHAIASACFAVRLAIVAALAWLLARPKA
jgi:hypothetical protein